MRSAGATGCRSLQALAARARYVQDRVMRVLNWPGCVALALVFGCSSPDRQTGATNPTDDDGPILIASSNGSLRLTADESRAYWAVANGGGIWGADLDGTEQWEVA